jgi:predicted MPP superfamily phosphohydrolase
MDPAAPASVRLAPRRYSNARLKAFRALEQACRLLGGRRFYRWRSLSPRGLEVRVERVPVPGLGRGLAGLRILQLSDLHAGPFLAAGDLAHVVERSAQLRPDLVVLTGDLISEVTDEAFWILPELAQLEAPLGKLAIFGNHDYRGRREHEIAERYAREGGWRFLRDEGVRLEREGASLYVTGLEDLEEAKRVDPDGARADLRPGEPELLLVHNPGFDASLLRAETALVLCGHTHGRQVNLPFVRRLAPHHPGDRFRRGAATVVVSRGLGALGVPLRVGAPAELVLCVLEEAD